MGRTEVYLSFARLGTSRPPVSVQVETRLSQGGGSAASVSTPAMNLTRVTHSTLQYVSSVAFEHATPLYGKESPTLESPFLRANSTRGVDDETGAGY